MKKSINLLKGGFESSSVTTPEFASIFRTFKSEFTKELKSIGATDIQFSRGHFYLSGFFTASSGQIYYFSISDVRGSEYRLPQLMYRTAQHYKDYTGGCNQWIDLATGMGENLSLK